MSDRPRTIRIFRVLVTGATSQVCCEHSADTCNLFTEPGAQPEPESEPEPEPEPETEPSRTIQPDRGNCNLFGQNIFCSNP